MASRQDRKVSDFKSVGETTVSRREQVVLPTPKPIGIKTPMEMGEGKNLYNMHYSLDRQIMDNLRNLLLTNHGERIGRYDMGANLMELALELGSEDIDTIAMTRIKSTVSKYMPFVNLIGFSTDIDHFDNKEVAKVTILVSYIIPKLNNSKKYAIKLTLYSAG